MEDQIRERVAELEAMRAEFITKMNLEVNREIAKFDGAIAELKALIDPPEDNTEQGAEEQNDDRLEE